MKMHLSIFCFSANIYAEDKDEDEDEERKHETTKQKQEKINHY